MLRTILNLFRNNRITVDANIARHLSFRDLKTKLTSRSERKLRLPYGHVCQIGDPVLRAQAQFIKPEVIETPGFQLLIEHLTNVMKIYDAMGISACQIGLPYQIFALRVTKKHLQDTPEDHRKIQEMELIPLKIFVNPKMKIIDYTTIRHSEQCLSILGYSAVVPRAQTIQIEALDISGEPFVWKATGWAARIAQHEMDHLQGKMYVDQMDANTFTCTHWHTINKRHGFVGMKFYPRHWLRRYLQI